MYDFLFTATGNSKFIAEKLAKLSGDTIMDIADCIKNERYAFVLNEDESFGIVTPVYFLGIPMIVSDFLQKLKLKSGRVFILTLY